MFSVNFSDYFQMVLRAEDGKIKSVNIIGDVEESPINKRFLFVS